MDASQLATGRAGQEGRAQPQGAHQKGPLGHLHINLIAHVISSTSRATHTGPSLCAGTVQPKPYPSVRRRVVINLGEGSALPGISGNLRPAHEGVAAGALGPHSD